MRTANLPPLPRRIAAGLVLWFYLVAATPFLPAASVIVACLDGEHRVLVQNGTDRVAIVLAHDANVPARASTHHHCPVAVALVSFSVNGGTGEADHVLQFRWVDPGALRAPKTAQPRSDLRMSVSLIAVAYLLPAVPVGPSPGRRPDVPAPPLALAALQSVVLRV